MCTDYLLNHTKRPWWSAVTSLPFKAVDGLSSWFAEDKPATERGEVDTFRLTRKENAVVKMLNNRINVIVDKKSVVTLSVTMQDPLISATLTDTVLSNLQNYITAYRTDKARRDLTFTQKLFDEAQREYYDAQQKYAHYMDANQDVILRSVRTEQERLQNEMNLAYNIYNQMAGQLQMARAKSPGEHACVCGGAAGQCACKCIQTLEDADSDRIRMSGRNCRVCMGIIWKGCCKTVEKRVKHSQWLLRREPQKALRTVRWRWGFILSTLSCSSFLARFFSIISAPRF